jgi:phage portal protein BeeE
MWLLTKTAESNRTARQSGTNAYRREFNSKQSAFSWNTESVAKDTAEKLVKHTA